MCSCELLGCACFQWGADFELGALSFSYIDVPCGSIGVGSISFLLALVGYSA